MPLTLLSKRGLRLWKGVGCKFALYRLRRTQLPQLRLRVWLLYFRVVDCLEFLVRLDEKYFGRVNFFVVAFEIFLPRMVGIFFSLRRVNFLF